MRNLPSVLHFANTTARIQAGVKKLCRLPSQTWQALRTVSLPQKKEIREEVGVQILLSIVKNLLSQKHGTTTAMFRKAEATPSK